MSFSRSQQHLATDNDDTDSRAEGPEESISVVVADQVSDTPSTAGPKDVLAATKAFIEDRCPFLIHFSSYTLGVLLILCVTVIWVASSNWIQYIFGDLNYSKPYFLTYFNTTGFSLWNLGYYLVPKWPKIPWDDRERPQPILVEDQSIVVDETHRHRPSHLDSGGGYRDSAGPTGPAGQFGRNVILPGSGGQVHERGGVAESTHDSVSRRRAARRDSNAATPLSTFHEPNYGTDIRVWAINNGYDPSIFSSEPSSLSDISVEELVDVGDLPDLTSQHRAPAAPFLVLEARESGRGGSSARQPPQRRLARVERVRPYSRRKIWFWAAVFCPFWFFANYLFNVSLSVTSVASNTVLSATSLIWTLLLSYLLLHESVGPLKWLAVVFCVTGSVLVGVSDKHSEVDGNKHTVFGDIIALVSALFYAVYTSILRFGLPDDDRYSMGMVFGAVGVINFVCLWPGLILVDLLSWEKFVWPTMGQFWPLLLNALIGTNLSDVLWARSVVLTSPVVATLGLALTTPLAMVVDAVFRGIHFSPTYVMGALFVMCGFVLVNLPILERWPRWMQCW